ncbi:MAG: hypothetical protein AB1458_08115 [Bacteroidota bacterium]
MSTAIVIPQVINKEIIPGLRFPDEEVLGSAPAIARRKADLERALALGNLEHTKVTLIFEDAEAVRQVETTVWGLTDKRVILKQGALIPIHRVHIVKL